jgi:hypothetical protein
MLYHDFTLCDLFCSDLEYLNGLSANYQLTEFGLNPPQNMKLAKGGYIG